MSARPPPEIELRLYYQDEVWDRFLETGAVGVFSFKCFCGEGFLLTGKQTLEAARDHVIEHLQAEEES